MTRDLPTFIVDDDAALREASLQALDLAGIPGRAFQSGANVLAELSPSFPGVVVTDIRMPVMDGLQLLDRIHAIDDQIPVILVTGHGDMGTAIEALRHGATDFLTKPFVAEHLVAAVRQAMVARRLTLDHRALDRAAAEAENEPSSLLGNDPAIVRLRSRISRLAPTSVNILIEGETGTGKELVALLLHRHGIRPGRPFVGVNCASLSDRSADLELFGYGGDDARQGGQRQIGRIEASHGGTLFLDEVDGMPLSVQAKLLRVIEERRVHPIGSQKSRGVDFRLIASAKSDLAKAVEQGHFRADLYHRLATVRLAIPPLRARRADIPMLFASHVQAAQEALGSAPFRLTDTIRRRLNDYDWGGNVRELRNFATQAVLGFIDLPEPSALPMTLPERMDRLEADIIQQALIETGGSIKDAVEQLGIPRKTLYDKITRYSIDLAQFREI